MIKSLNASKVVIAGAGPGDPDLITIKALRYLQSADVVIIDRLVSRSLLDYTKLGAKILFVGKAGGNDRSVSQEAINKLLVEEARPGKTVLRLKGGDVSFFSNITAELEALVANNIPFEIIPGVTAASGASACAGIPLTSRGLASGVRFLAYTHPDLVEESQIEEYVATDDTLICYMASRNINSLVERLISKGISSEKWVAVIEQATTPQQRVFALSIHDFASVFARKNFASPSIVVIGKVAQLHQKFKWQENSASDNAFFESLSENTLNVKVA